MNVTRKFWQTAALGLIILSFVSFFLIQNNFNRKPAAFEAVPKYTDMHVHLACVQIDENGCYFSPEMRASFKFNPYLKALGVTLKEMRTSNNQILVDRLAQKIKDSTLVRRAVVLALDGWVNRTTGQLDLDQSQVIVPNDYVLAATKKYPGLFFYGPSINPYRTNAIALLEQSKRDGAVLVKWIPSIMNIDPADAQLIPFYQKLRELDLPLLVHAGQEDTFASAVNELSDPMKLKVPLDLGVKVIAAHMASSGEDEGIDDAERLIELFKEPRYRDLLFADISANTQFN